ncbi:Hypothetical_protein [Hexamita inflata]|uniref:Hypothetical_protein n=1 Tax=Hexamita inflata TaxID=28002 RepID=A0AA86QZJ7_9EUKA|nr:Hypothetical protein HINF_LOCUS50289 [Hexamita inflata]
MFDDFQQQKQISNSNQLFKQEQIFPLFQQPALSVTEFIKVAAQLLNYQTVNEVILVTEILTLSSTASKQFWVEIAYHFNLSRDQIVSFFQSQVITKCSSAPLVQPPIQLPSEPLPTPQDQQQQQQQQQQQANNIQADKQYKIRAIRQKQSEPAPTASSLFQNEFTTALKQILTQLSNKSHLSHSNAELCTSLNSFLQLNRHSGFWDQLQNKLQNKTVKQLREYYANTYQKVLYTTFITVQDKIILTQLNENNPNEKPATITKMFMKMHPETKYFKHNVTMYVINQRTQLDKEK